MFEIFAAYTNRENPSCSQADNWAERLLKAQTTIAKKSRSSRCFEYYWREDQWDSSRRTNMIDGDLRSKRHSPASVPHRVTFSALNEEVTLPGVVVRRGDCEGVDIPTLDIVLDALAMEMCI